MLYFGDNRKEVEKIKISGSIGSSHQFYKNEVNPQYDWLTIDYERAVQLLLDGLDFIEIKKEILTEDSGKRYY